MAARDDGLDSEVDDDAAKLSTFRGESFLLDVAISAMDHIFGLGVSFSTLSASAFASSPKRLCGLSDCSCVSSSRTNDSLRVDVMSRGT